MATQIQTYLVTDGDQQATVERAGDAWMVQGNLVNILLQYNHTALPNARFDTAEDAQSAAEDALAAFNGFLDHANHLAS